MTALEAMQYAATFAGSMVAFLLSLFVLVRRVFVKPFQDWLAEKIDQAVAAPINRLNNQMHTVKEWQKNHVRHHPR